MIQRIQSIFLLLVNISLFSTYFFPLSEKIVYTNENNIMAIKEKETLYIYELVYEQYISENDTSAILYPRPYILVLIFIAGGLSFYSIFQYNNRINQIKIGAINSIIMSVTIAIILYELFYKEVMIKNTFDVNILISFYLIFTALIFNSIANRFIKKDEILVNESNRIR